MFSTFATDEDRNLIIRTENLQHIRDTSDGCFIVWEENNTHHRSRVLGTAAENYSRLQAEELRLIDAAAARQQRYNAALPLSPIPRGRAAR